MFEHSTMQDLPEIKTRKILQFNLVEPIIRLMAEHSLIIPFNLQTSLKDRIALKNYFTFVYLFFLCLIKIITKYVHMDLFVFEVI